MNYGHLAINLVENGFKGIIMQTLLNEWQNGRIRR